MNLTPEQARITREKGATLNRKPAELFELLAGVADFDAETNKKARNMGIGCGFLCIGAVIMIFVASNFDSIIPKIFLALLVIGAIAAGVTRKRLLRFDVSDDLRRFVIPVLSLLREDADPEQPMRIRLDLTPSTDKAHLKSEGPAKVTVGKGTESFYHHPWVECEAILADGNRLRWSVVDNVRKRRITKRTPRGKYKIKTKYKRKSVIDVEIKSREKKYGVIAEQAFNPSGYETREKGSSIALRNVVVTSNLDSLDPKELMSVILAAYSRLEPLKKGGAA